MALNCHFPGKTDAFLYKKTGRFLPVFQKTELPNFLVGPPMKICGIDNPIIKKIRGEFVTEFYHKSEK